MGHDYYDKDAVFNSYIKELATNDWDEESLTTITVDENLLGPDVLKNVEKVHDQVIVS
jgi:hypothetical protein|tara:strand:+ start:153 stop:326 length:174 start_codon:yes stop_codon:yes gene_type:complete